MAQMYPRSVTDGEHTAQAVTKYRWMTSRDAHTTTQSLGFRIDGVAGSDSWLEIHRDFEVFRNVDQVSRALKTFAIGASGGCGSSALDIAEGILERLRYLS